MRIVDLRAAYGSIPAVVLGATRDQNSPIRKQSGRVFGTSRDQAACLIKLSGSRVVKLGSWRNTVRIAARDENASIVEQGRCVRQAAVVHGANALEGESGKVENL